jgi:hypothetical protein
VNVADDPERLYRSAIRAAKLLIPLLRELRRPLLRRYDYRSDEQSAD